MKTNEALSEIIGFKKRNISQNEFGKALNVTKQYVGQIMYKELTNEQIKQLEDYFNIDFTKVNNSEHVTLDYYPDIEVSCGNGIIPFGETKEKMTVPVSLIKGYSKNKKYVIVSATSDSMQPEIKEKDMLIVRMTDGENIMDNHIYIFCHDGRFYCKHLSYNLGQLIVRSTNPDYPIRHIEQEDLQNFELIGEVVGLMRDLR